MISRTFKRISSRDLYMAATPAAIVAALAVVVTLFLVEPGPPKTIVVSTGAADSGYHMFAQRYKDLLARDGVTLDLRVSAGSQENVGRLMDEKSGVEVGFFQGGSAFAANAPNLRSLGSIYYEPLWVFYRGAEAHDFGNLKGKRIAIGPEASGTRALALQLLAVNATVMPPTCPRAALKRTRCCCRAESTRCSWYAFRQNVDLVRERVRGRMAGQA